MSQFFTWLEQRIREYEVARERGLKAYDTRIKRVLAERNDGIEPTESSAGFHAPFDGYVHVWWEGDCEFEAVYLAGQFLPYSKERVSLYSGAFTGDVKIRSVPVDRADKFIEQYGQMPAEVRKTVIVSRSRSWVDEDSDELRCYVYISKCPDDLCAAIEDYLMGDIYKLQRLAVEQSEDKKAARDKAHAEGEDAPEGRVVITGTVLAFKRQGSEYGDILKMLVQDDRGFRVWGTVPKSLDDAERESRISFTANLTQSDKDSKFGFFKRPTKAALLDDEAAAA
jgi:hypothetical protein